jgi:hypothetical protein
VLEEALADESCFVVAAAAKLIAEEERTGFVAALARAFHRFIPDAVRRDPGCRAKTAVVRALLGTGEHDVAVYLAGVRHIQPEPTWGKSEDSAGELRAQSLAGLIRSRHPGASVANATLLVDPERPARAGAAEAAAELHPDVAVPLLRLKVSIGDAEPEVIGACWVSLLSLAPEESLAAAAAALETARSEAEAEAIALALGASRLEGAIDPLIAWSERIAPASRRAAFTALALLRRDRALDHLIGVIASGRFEHARDALRALAHFRHDPRLVERVREAIASRGDAKLQALADESFAREEDPS